MILSIDMSSQNKIVDRRLWTQIEITTDDCMRTLGMALNKCMNLMEG